MTTVYGSEGEADYIDCNWVDDSPFDEGSDSV